MVYEQDHNNTNTLMSQLCSLISVENLDNDIPSNNYLEQNYPNPFNPLTIINYSVKIDGFISLRVFDVLGNLVVTLVDVEQSAGNYNIEFNASKVSSDVYFYVLQLGRLFKLRNWFYRNKDQNATRGNYLYQ